MVSFAMPPATIPITTIIIVAIPKVRIFGRLNSELPVTAILFLNRATMPMINNIICIICFSLESNATILARRAKNVSLEFYEEIQQIKSG